MKIVTDASFKLSGAAFGSDAFCNELMQKRACKAGKIMQKAVDLSSAKSALLIIRQCASFCKQAYAVRVIPPQRIAPALPDYTAATREALQNLVEAEIDNRQWASASSGIKDGGLGL